MVDPYAHTVCVRTQPLGGSDRHVNPSGDVRRRDAIAIAIGEHLEHRVGFVDVEAQPHVRATAQRFDDLVIGAGMAGLTVGSLLAADGRRVLVVDAHDTPGGYAHTFAMGAYRFCAQVHYIFSCGEGDGTGLTENEKRKKKLGTGLPTSPRISVGNSEEEEGECEEMKVVVITSEGEVSSDCAGHRPNSGTYLREWREDGGLKGLELG